MKIEILGTGCPKCKLLEEHTKQAIAETGKTADLAKVTDMVEIALYGVMSTPAIVVDGEVKAYGVVSSVDEIKKMIE